MRRAAGLAAVLLGGLALWRCTLVTDFTPSRYLEQTEERCSDGVDNDDNGLIDCADPGCKIFDFCHENSEARCSDGRDNDADGLVDCEDPDCCPFDHCALEPSCGERTAFACSDGIDNDGNGLVDCADFGCTGPPCCRQLVPIIAETFSTSATDCVVPDCCTDSSACCCKPIAYCNGFDNDRWVAWGVPPPALRDGAFTGNQPCRQSCVDVTSATCFSGLISLASTALSPNLHLELEALVPSRDDSVLAIGLVEGAVVPMDDVPCNRAAPLPMLAGLKLTSKDARPVLGGGEQESRTARPGELHRFRITVDANGRINFYQDEVLIHESAVKVSAPYPTVRLLIQTHGCDSSMDNVLLARSNGCPAHRAWAAGPGGPGAALAPTQEPTSFDHASVSSPSILFDGTTHRLYYTASSPKGITIGMATSSDGQRWERQNKPLAIANETATWLSDPCVIRHEDRLLMAYRAKSPGEGAVIAIAEALEEGSWERRATALAPAIDNAWDDGDLAAPALLFFHGQLHLWYSGQAKSGGLPAIGLARAKSGTYDFVRAGAAPVLAPQAGGLDDRGATDPWVMEEDGLLHLWYVGLTWGGKTQINYARSQNGSTWVRYPENPVVAPGQTGIFGGTEVRGPTVLSRWGQLQMWYGGVEPSGLPSIGHLVNAGQAD